MSPSRPDEDHVMPGSSAGPATYRHNDPVIDPTANVRELVDAAVVRLNDLAVMDAYWRSKLDSIRSDHSKEIRKAESDRIDAIRAVDVGAVAAAASAAETRANALAAQVAASAEAMRTQVAAAAAAAAAALTAALDPIQKDIADLRRVQYEGVGQKTQIVETRSTSQVAIAAIGAVIAAVVLALAFYAAFHKLSAGPPSIVTVTTPAGKP